MQERRFHSTQKRPATLVCRVCLSDISLSGDRITFQDVDWVMSCPLCGGTFPVRAEDAGDRHYRTPGGYR